IFLRLSLRAICVFVFVVAALPAGAATVIDFETPSLGAADRAINNPYSAAGVTFTAVSGGFGDEVVGLVKNSATSACVDPADANKKLGTGGASSVDGAIGLGAFTIRADFPGPPAGPTTTVSVEYQCTAGATITLKLYDSVGNEVGSDTKIAGPPDGTCG